MTPRYLHRGERLRVSVLGDHPEQLIVTFDHWSRTKDGFEPVRTRSSYVQRGFTHLHFSTARNDWFLNEELPEALLKISRFAEAFPRKITLAFSMGGYGALLVSRVVGFQQAMLVSPHSSFSPAYPPHDGRFTTEVDNSDFADLANDMILSSLPSEADCVIVYDSTEPYDTEHAEASARLFRSARLVDLKGGGHPATQVLTGAQRFGVVMRAAIGDRIDTGEMEALHEKLADQPA